MLESTRVVDTIVLDKTGTVTTGQMKLVDVITVDGVEAADVLRFAGAVEDASEHPIGQAIASGAVERLDAQLPAVEGFTSTQGLGVAGLVDGHAVAAGRPAWLRDEWSQPLDLSLAAATDAAEAEGRTAVAVGWDGAARGVLVVSDTVKPTSAQAVTELKALGLRPVLLTGDNERAARAVAAEVGIDEVIAEVLPADKVAVVRRLQDEGRRSASSGTGSTTPLRSPPPTLASRWAPAPTSPSRPPTSPWSAATCAPPSTPSALTQDPGHHQGQPVLAFAYNVAALLLAAFGLLNPLIAAAAMAFSSVFVVSNSLRLRRFRAVSTTPGRKPSAADSTHTCPPRASIRLTRTRTISLDQRERQMSHPTRTSPATSAETTAVPPQRCSRSPGSTGPAARTSPRQSSAADPAFCGRQPGLPDRDRDLRPDDDRPDPPAGLGARVRLPLRGSVGAAAHLRPDGLPRCA